MSEVTHEKMIALAERAESLVTEANGLIVSHIITCGESGRKIPQKLITATGLLMTSSVFIGTAKMYSAKLQMDNMAEQDNEPQDEPPMGVEDFLKKMGAIKEDYQQIQVTEPTVKAPDWETYAKSLVSHIASDAPKDSKIKAKQRLVTLLDQVTQ